MSSLSSHKHHTIIPATTVEVEFISNKIVEFNKSQVPFTQKQTPIFKNYVIKENDLIIAGIHSCLYHWGILCINVLFVDENHRGKQLGCKLLEYVENEAIVMGATLCHLDTFDFQAKDFYLKQGYKIFGVLEDCPKDHKRYYLSKPLNHGDRPQC